MEQILKQMDLSLNVGSSLRNSSGFLTALCLDLSVSEMGI